MVTHGGGNGYGKSKMKSRLGTHPGKGRVTAEELLENEKTALVAKKHEELEDVWNKHDMLVSIFLFMPHYISSHLTWSGCRSGRCFIWRVIR